MSTSQRTLVGLDINIFVIVPLRSSKEGRADFESEVGTADIAEEELPYTLDFIMVDNYFNVAQDGE